ncbi:MAG TPA: alpha-1,2-fucosyltransferase [Bacteroidia bacterium]|jgi:hypothetical protein|nr:alpha-1,2-fucosyltransferase [Bacteroidia bacterium]
MIITRLSGGLGNQMFQYAFALRMAEQLHTELKMDLGFFTTPQNSLVTPRTYELGCWGINPLPVSETELNAFLQPPKRGLSRLFRRSSAQTLNLLIKEKQFRFDTSITELQGNLYLDGYWQSETYFKPVADKISGQYNLQALPDNRNKELEQTLLQCESVAIHVRRKDYMKTPEILAFHGVLPASYYQEAVRIMEEKHKNIRLFIFSDDAEWTQQNLKFDLPVSYINHNTGNNSYLDLWLMSRCKHQVTANSSFSWWAAWLNPNPQKTVIAPRQWFAGAEPDTTDLVPSTWIRI